MTILLMTTQKRQVYKSGLSTTKMLYFQSRSFKGIRSSVWYECHFSQSITKRRLDITLV